MQAQKEDQAVSTLLRGGAFVVTDSLPEDLFTPEEKNEEQKMILSMVQDFMKQDVLPNTDAIEKQKDNIAATLIEKIGELGILGAHMPEEYGGMQLDENTNTLIADALGPVQSFTVAFAAHTGIGMLPILYFGTEDQKSKYLPGLISGQLKAAYCLTEPGSGSDALGAKTTAILNDAGTHYVMNGQKMWITNAGFADVFIVFAQIDGDKFTGFIVDADTDGLTLGAEEDKLGIKGSSTRQVFFENALIPADHTLGQIGKGHLIAFNALNVGRFKLGALCMGANRSLIGESVQYANERKQFGVSISSFGAIQYKLAEQAIRNFALTSAQYRVSELLRKKAEEFKAAGHDFGQAKLKSAEEYAIECAILKVAGSEILDYIVDETVQIHGGIGYSEEYPVAGYYRNARINRIFEGTNEINRLLMVDMLYKRGMAGAFDIVGPAWEVQKELSSMPKFDMPSGDYGHEEKALQNMKKIFLMTLGGAAKKQMDGELNLKKEQMLLMNAADMMIDIFLMESTLLRVKKISVMDTGVNKELYKDILKTFTYDAMDRVAKNAKDAVMSYAGGDLLKIFTMGIQRFNSYTPLNVKETRTRIAESMINANDNIFSTV